MTAIRRPGAASAAVLIGLTASLFAAHTIAPQWSRRAGLDVWNLSAEQELWRTATRERADVDAQDERARRRREVAAQVAARLTAGELSLPAAADELMELFRTDAGTCVALSTVYLGMPSERHMFARNAIDRAARHLEGDSARRAALLARLEAEYREMCTGTVSPAPR